MTCVLTIGMAAMLLGSAAWASNIWPGVATWRTAALSRLLWWGLPFSGIALLCDVPLDHAVWLGSAAWVGAWVPHTEMPDIRSHPDEMLANLAIVVLRVAALLSFPAAVFWVCGAFWFAMVLAVAAVLPCILLANLGDVDLPGLRTRRQVAGALFGASTGLWVAVAIIVPDPLVDHLL